jgi:hypothetical protein
MRFVDSVPGDDKNRNPARWAGLPVGTPLGHANGGGPIVFSKIVGPVLQIGPGAFALNLDRSIYTANRRNNDIWLLASQLGDDQYKSIVQQVMVRAQPNKDGMPQHITFPEIVDQKPDVKQLKLLATSDAKLPVHYYVREGPAEMKGDTLVFSPIPPRGKLPFTITVVAWQWGTSKEPKSKVPSLLNAPFTCDHDACALVFMKGASGLTTVFNQF